MKVEYFNSYQQLLLEICSLNLYYKNLLKLDKYTYFFRDSTGKPVKAIIRSDSMKYNIEINYVNSDYYDIFDITKEALKRTKELLSSKDALVTITTLSGSTKIINTKYVLSIGIYKED